MTVPPEKRAIKFRRFSCPMRSSNCARNMPLFSDVHSDAPRSLAPKTALVAFDGEPLPREVRYSCDGINTHGAYTAPGFRVAQHLITTDSDHKDLVVFTPQGEPVAGAVMPADIYVAGRFHDYMYGAADLARMILHTVNLCNTDTSNISRASEKESGL
jgi:hypothetical protein